MSSSRLYRWARVSTLLYRVPRPAFHRLAFGASSPADAWPDPVRSDPIRSADMRWRPGSCADRRPAGYPGGAMDLTSDRTHPVTWTFGTDQVERIWAETRQVF